MESPMINLVWIALLALAGGDDVPPFGFTGVELYKASSRAQNLVATDFNADGRLDFALANNERSRLEIFLQKTKADDAPPGEKPTRPRGYDDVNEIHDDARFRKVLIPVESTVHAMVAGDLDGDGAPEIAVRGVPSRLTIWKQKGADRWEIAQKFKIEQGMGPHRSLLIADLNGDGRQDLALLEKERVALHFQGKNGRLQPAKHFPTALRDATGLAFVRPRDGAPTLVLFKVGDENGVASRPLLEGSLGPEWIFRTGKMKSIHVRPQSERLAVLGVMSVSDRLHEKTVRARTRDEAVFETPLALYPVAAERGANERGASTGDVNGDGLTDVVVSRPSASTLGVYLQRPDGFLGAPRTSSTFADTTGVEVGDFDRDGKIDVLVVSAEEQVVGLATWAGDRLTFPRILEGIEGKPHTATGVDLIEAGRLDLAVITERKRKYWLTVMPGFAGKPIDVKLDFLKDKPQRLLAVDIDADGDKDLAVIPKRDALGLVLNEGDGKFTALGSEAFGGKWLLKDVETASYSAAVLPGGRPALLVAKKNLGRAVGLDKNRKLIILEQINAGENTKLVGIARSDDAVVAADERSSALIVLRKIGGEWKRVQDIDLPSNIIRSIQAVPLRKDDRARDVVVAEKSGFLVVRRGQRETRLESVWSYETEVKGARLRLIAEGDLNHDGRPDLAVTDNEERALELLVPPAEAGGKVKRALRFKIFEEAQAFRRRASYVREMIAADLTGDKKTDLLFLLHDRVVLYPQE